MQDETQLCKCSNGMYNWDGECMYQTLNITNCILLRAVPESLNQEALLCVVQDACNQPLTVCQKCVSQPCSKPEASVSDEQYHIILIEGTMILALQ